VSGLELHHPPSATGTIYWGVDYPRARPPVVTVAAGFPLDDSEFSAAAAGGVFYPTFSVKGD